MPLGPSRRYKGTHRKIANYAGLLEEKVERVRVLADSYQERTFVPGWTVADDIRRALLDHAPSTDDSDKGTV